MINQRLLLTFLLMWQSIQANNLLEEMKANPSFSKALEIIEANKILAYKFESGEYTAFMPTNEAFDKYTGRKDMKLIEYHLTNLPFKIQNVPDEITTDLSGNPRLYVTKIPSGNPSITGWEDYEYYINNAKVISANHRATASTGGTQYLHTIDQVVVPTVPQVSGPNAHTYRSPDAKKFLENSNVYGFTDQKGLRELFNRVKELEMLDSFGIDGHNTFFMPVNHALKLVMKTDKVLIDKKVLQGHIVPDEVLFTRTMRNPRQLYKTMAVDDKLKAFISLNNVTNSDTKEVTYYVTSNMVHRATGKNQSALARIVQGNIPVRNGVVHLIDRPLMVIASTIMSYLQEEEGQLSKFHRLMADHYNDMTTQLMTKQDITLFAPSNKAFELVNVDRLDKVIANHEKLKKVLRLHVVDKRLTTNEIMDKTAQGQIYMEDTLTPSRQLYFTVDNPNAEVPQFFLEGGGVNASITTPNIATKNGIIHIIDRILGIPSQTVYEKLATDSLLSKTFALSEQKQWNRFLQNREQKFTLFVPSNDAWDYINREMPSAYKKLFMGSYPVHSRNILQRHIIRNEALSLKELEVLTTNSTPIRDNLRQTQLQMTRDKIYFQARISQTYGEYFLEWNGLSARVIRPDVECVNGIVHVIDKVLMAKRDVTVSASSRLPSGMSTMVAVGMSAVLAWTLV